MQVEVGRRSGVVGSWVRENKDEEQVNENMERVKIRGYSSRSSGGSWKKKKKKKKKKNETKKRSQTHKVEMQAQ